MLGSLQLGKHGLAVGALELETTGQRRHTLIPPQVQRGEWKKDSLS